MMRIKVPKDIVPGQMAYVSLPHPLSQLRAVTPRARSKFISHTSQDVRVTHAYAGFRGACLSSIETLVQRGVIDATYVGKTSPGKLFFYPREDILLDNNRASLLGMVHSLKITPKH